MNPIHARVSHPHGHEGAAAEARLERLMAAIAGRFPGYNFRWTWDDDSHRRATYTFEKAGKGQGGGFAALKPGGVDVELTGSYKLPFYVPVALAEMKVRDEVTKALELAFD